MIEAAKRACLRLLPWAPAEHDSVMQESLERALAKIRAGGIEGDNVDLAGYVYGVTRHCVQEKKRKLYKQEMRACALPENDELMESLFEEPPDDSTFEGTSVDIMRQRLLEVLRYYVVHMFSTATEKKRRQAIRDTFILARHYLRELPLADIAKQLGISRRACQYAVDRTNETLMRLFDPETGDVRSFVENSTNFESISELTDFLRVRD